MFSACMNSDDNDNNDIKKMSKMDDDNKYRERGTSIMINLVLLSFTHDHYRIGMEIRWRSFIRLSLTKTQFWRS